MFVTPPRDLNDLQGRIQHEVNVLRGNPADEQSRACSIAVNFVWQEKEDMLKVWVHKRNDFKIFE